MLGGNGIGPFRHHHEYTAAELASLPIDLLAAAPVSHFQPGQFPAKALRAIAGSGTVTVAEDGLGAEELSLSVGDEVLGQFTAVTAVSGITRLRVSW